MPHERRPSPPRAAWLLPILSCALVSGARAAAPLPGFTGSAPVSRTVPLPGFAHGPEAAATETPFPSATKTFGAGEDPLESLALGGEELRDSLAPLPTAAALQAALRSPEPLERLAAIRAAGRPRGVESVAHLRGVLLRLDQPVELRAAAALSLGRIGDGIAVPALEEALRDPAPPVRYAAALALGRIPMDGVATKLERVLRVDPEWTVRYAAVIALGKTKRAFVADILAGALAGDASWQVRQQAARSLQDIGTEGAAEALVPALRDDDASVRAAAGTALGEIGSAEQRRALKAALRDETDPAVRAMLTLAVRRGLR
jgi:HEAT repeat protein